MSTEVVIGSFQELPGGPEVKIVIDANRKAQVRANGNTLAA